MTETFFEAAKQAEIYLRGRTLQISSHIESLLAQMLIICKADDSNWEGYKFKGMTFEQKIAHSRDLLKDKMPLVYQMYSPVFDQLIISKAMRNKIAHCKFDWDEKEPTTVTIWDLKVESHRPKDGAWLPEKHNYKDIVKVVEDLKQQALTLNKIVQYIRADFDNRFPGLLNLVVEE